MGSFLGGLVGHSPGFWNWKSIDLLSAIASRLTRINQHLIFMSVPCIPYAYLPCSYPDTSIACIPFLYIPLNKPISV